MKKEKTGGVISGEGPVMGEYCGESIMACDQKNKVLSDFYKKIKDNQKDLDPEFANVLSENVWDLV